MHESKYIEKTSLDYRKDYGQFFTPPAVARLMTNWIMKDNPKTILDPAFGLGVFYDEVIKRPTGNQADFIGYELDENILTFLNHEASHPYLRIINSDYLESDAGHFDGIICNPPYMRFQKFLKRHSILPKIEKTLGKKLMGYSNISSVFLVKSLNELNVNGNLAFIMPFEFFNTGYGKQIKKCLLDNHLLKHIIVFSNEKDVFPDATTTVCIILCKNDGKEEAIKIAQVSSNDEIERISDVSNFYQRRINSSDLPFDKKWTPIILSLFSEQESPNGFCKLSLYGTVKRGIATGANDFFSLKKSTIEKWDLSSNNICKCITKSSQLRKSLFNDYDFDCLFNSDKPVYCLDVKDHNNPQVRRYILEGERLDYNQRYLTKTRQTWYKIENREPAPILFGVFNRGRLKVVRNYTKAINFTCFHSFYPNVFGQQILDKLFTYLISDVGQKIIKANKRSYGDELDKFEPGDLNDSLCPNQKQFEMISREDAEKVIELASIDEKKAIELSNSLIMRIMSSNQSAVLNSISGINT